MGQAAARKRNGTYPAVTTRTEPAHVRLEYPARWLNDRYGTEPVAMALAGIEIRGLPRGAGDCVPRHYLAHRALMDIGVANIPMWGAMALRAGRAETDLLVFGDADLQPVRDGNGQRAHTWLMFEDGSLADFTIGNWPQIDDHAPGMAPINWQVRLPDHWWFRLGTFALVDLIGPSEPVRVGSLKPGHVIYRPVARGFGCDDEHLGELDQLYANTRGQILRAIDHNQAHWRGRFTR